MDNAHFKILFNQIALKNGFSKAYGAWFWETLEGMISLELQKSNYSKLYYLNFKVYIQGLFNKTYLKSKDLMRKEVGNIFLRHPKEFNNAFDLECTMEDSEREKRIEEVFSNFVVPYTNALLTINGINEFEKEGKIYILPAVREELDKLVELRKELEFEENGFSKN